MISVQRITHNETLLLKQFDAAPITDLFAAEDDVTQCIPATDNRLSAKVFLLKKLTRTPLLIDNECFATFLEESDLYPTDFQQAMKELLAISDDADAAEIYASDPRTEAATSLTRSSKADFVRAMLSMMDELKDMPSLYSPSGFNLSDSAMADLVNVCLKLSAEELIYNAYVKNLRHREKQFV